MTGVTLPLLSISQTPLEDGGGGGKTLTLQAITGVQFHYNFAF